MCAQLSSSALEAPDANEFLGFLGFDFQKDGARDKDPFVVFPHWDPDGFLAMSSQMLQAVCGKIERDGLDIREEFNSRTRLNIALFPYTR